MKVDINEVVAIQNRRREINSVPLHHIEWYDGDKRLEIAPGIIDEFLFMGLNNIDFIDMEMYLAKDPDEWTVNAYRKEEAEKEKDMRMYTDTVESYVVLSDVD